MKIIHDSGRPLALEVNLRCSQCGGIFTKSSYAILWDVDYADYVCEFCKAGTTPKDVAEGRVHIPCVVMLPGVNILDD